MVMVTTFFTTVQSTITTYTNINELKTEYCNFKEKDLKRGIEDYFLVLNANEFSDEITERNYSKGTVMQIDKSLINDRLRVSKVS